MARVTVEDCIEIIPNRFELVLFAAKRAREISAGSQLTIARNNDKNPVVALREIAEQSVSLIALRDGVIKSMQRNVFSDEGEPELEDELQEAMQADQSWTLPTIESDGDDSEELEEIDESDEDDDDSDETEDKVSDEDETEE
jgi:DNA-directed RNA polymerase subunit omega